MGSLIASSTENDEDLLLQSPCPAYAVESRTFFAPFAEVKELEDFEDDSPVFAAALDALTLSCSVIGSPSCSVANFVVRMRRV